MSRLKHHVAGAVSRVGGTWAIDALWGERLTVLLYHRIADPGSPDFAGFTGTVSASPEEFERQARYVAANFDVIALDDLLAFLDGASPLPPRALLITFDDGYADNHSHALPVLRALSLPAVEFIITGAIGTDLVPWWDECAMLLGDAAADTTTAALKRMTPDERAAAMDDLRRRAGFVPPPPRSPLFMSWEQVAELERHGISCQPHTHTHPILSRVGPERLRDEVTRSRMIVEHRLGHPAHAFAFPNGTSEDYDADAVQALLDSGCRVAFTTEVGPVRAASLSSRRMEVPRVSVDASDGFEMFRLKAHGLSPVVARLRTARRAVLGLRTPHPVVAPPGGGAL